MKNYNLKPIEFKFGDYLSEGFELFKKDIGGFVLAYFFVMIMSIIPIFAYLGIGNFYKFCRKIKSGEQASASEIFNFDNFSPYFIISIIIFGISFGAMLPMFLIFPAIFSGSVDESNAGFMMFPFMMYVFALMIGLYIIMIKGFYVPALISLEGEKDWKTAWKTSKVMTKRNMLMIFLLMLVAGFIGQLGFILCGIGIFLTMPLIYIFNYMAFEDALDQIKKDEIAEIGNRTSF